MIFYVDIDFSKKTVIITNCEENDIKYEPLGSGYFAVTSKDCTFCADSILLADFADRKTASNLCDLCAGCGIVSLLWSADGSRRKTLAVEIQESAADLINKAVLYNKLSNITIVNDDLKNLDKEYNGKFDLVACNPPYKKEGTGAKSTNAASLTARHEVSCRLEDIIKTGARLLNNGGRFSLCHRPERICDIMSLMREYKLEPKRMRLVAMRASKEPWLVLIEGKKSAKPGLIVEPLLIAEDKNGNYTEEMSSIYNKFNFAADSRQQNGD